MKIEGIKHEWIEHSECDFFKCKKKKNSVTWCDECDKAFCKEHEDYHNDYEEGLTYCNQCWKAKQHWNKERLKQKRVKNYEMGEIQRI